MRTDKETRFRPRLGTPRSKGDRQAKHYVKRILTSVDRLNAGQKMRSGIAMTGRQGARGYAVGNYLSGRSALRPSHNNRRVVIKARIVKLAGTGAAKAHLGYIQRDGVSRGGEPGRLYDATGDNADGDAFNERGGNDRHQFRFIVSPEDAAEIDDFKSFTRELMARMESDLDTILNWVAVDHFNTDNPHSHIVVHGKDQRGGDLVIARDYIGHGMRERASEILTRDLGPRQAHEIEAAMRREIKQERFTATDRRLLRDADNSLVDLRGEPAPGYGRFLHGLNRGRLDKLEALGLASESEPGLWRLSDEMQTTLSDMQTRADIIKTLHREMARAGREAAPGNYAIFRPEQRPGQNITGRLTALGLADELNDRYYAVIEGLDGKTHYAEIGQPKDLDDLKHGAIVSVEARTPGPRAVDHTIAEIAAAHNGLYSADHHHAHDPRASPAFVQSHIRRLESLRRLHMVSRLADGSWQVPGTYLDEAAAHEERRATGSPVRIVIRSAYSLDVQATATGATWLDRTLIAKAQPAVARHGFGAEVEDALQRRRAYLLREGLARETATGLRTHRQLIRLLEQRELDMAASKITEDTGKAYRASAQGQRVEGIYRKPVDLVSGRFALVEQSKEFTLVPWRPVLERARGQSVTGTLGGTGISWDITRQKGLSRC